MTQSAKPFPSDMRELLKLVEGTEFEELAKDESKLERIVVEAMRTAEDPVTREIGEGLASGTMTWRTVATTSAYAEFLDENLAALQRFDMTGLVESLRLAQLEAAHKRADERELRERDDDEDVWQGLDGNDR